MSINLVKIFTIDKNIYLLCYDFFMEQKMEYKFGERLKELRTEKELTTRALAEKIGTNNANISNWENNKNFPSIIFIYALCDFFDVSADFLLGRED